MLRPHCPSIPVTLPDGSTYQYNYKTYQKWVSLYKNGGIDALMPSGRSDKGVPRVLPDEAIAEIFRLKEEFPRLNATRIHQKLIQDGFLPATVSVCAVQRFIKRNDLKSARNPNIRDRKAFEGGHIREDTVSIESVSCDVPMQFISARVEIRYRPGEMDSAFILYDGKQYLLRQTDKVANRHTKRQNTPSIDYGKAGASHV